MTLTTGAALTLAGCGLQQRVEAAAPAERCEVRGITSVYSLGRLETRLPASVPLQGVVIAGRQSLERRGYTVRSFGVTGDEGHVRARGGAGGETVRITARNELDEIRVRVHVGALGDRDVSISVMGDVLGRLGY